MKHAKQGYVALIALAVVAGASGLAFADEPAGVARLDEYRGWRDCYRLSNAEMSVVVAPRVGGRLVELVYKGRPFIWRDPGLDGSDISCGTVQSYGAMPGLYRREWIEWDGCQPDAWDEKGNNQHSPLWCSPYAVKSTADYTLVLESQPATDSGAQAQIVKTFALDPARPVLKFGYALKNLDDKPRKWALYYRCRLMPGLLLTPAPEGVKFALYPDNKGLEPAVRGQCMRITPDNMAAVLPQNLMLAPAAEVALDAKTGGWLAIARHDALLRVSWPLDPGAAYRDDTTLSVYWEGRFADIAPRSPIKEVAPGKTFSFDTVWTCAPYDGSGSDFSEIPGVKATVDAMAKENP